MKYNEDFSFAGWFINGIYNGGKCLDVARGNFPLPNFSYAFKKSEVELRRNWLIIIFDEHARKLFGKKYCQCSRRSCVPGSHVECKFQIDMRKNFSYWYAVECRSYCMQTEATGSWINRLKRIPPGIQACHSRMIRLEVYYADYTRISFANDSLENQFRESY